MTSSNSRSEQLDYSSQLSESSSERRDVLERTEDDGDESFCPETEDDELSSDGSTIKNGNANLQQIVSASDAGCSVQAVSSDHEENVEEDPEELQRIRRTQKIFKELHFDNPGRQLAERVSIDRSVTEYSNSRPKRNNKNKNKTSNRESSRNANKANGSTNRLSHNQKGQLITNRGTVDLCDCLSLECSGCNYPCKKCGSQKCSYSCRNNRRTYIESIDELGSGITKNPFL
uniref:ARF7EP_C domain-containing protein n=1 Tax=Meloidogyne hapla TaxID=6305 RepID=A0A1I8BJL9_MELHA